MSRIFGIALVIAISASPFNPGAAQGGEVKLLSALVMKPALADLASTFERTSGHTLTIVYDPAGAVTKRIQSGETADVAIIQKPAIEALIKEGKIVSGSNIILARSGVGAAVRQGAPKPERQKVWSQVDLSTI
jgi:molybdate transport system substrate-binding protein